MATLNIEDKIKLHELATEHLIARKFPTWASGTTEFEDKYLAFYEKIFNKLKELTNAE